MAANIEKQQKFMTLRAEGKSFDAIANKIKVSKPTLIKWSKDFKDQIVELSKTIEEQFLIEQKIKRTMRGQRISEELDKAYDALSKTDYKDMNKKELINVIDKLEEKINNIILNGENKKRIEINDTPNNKNGEKKAFSLADFFKENFSTNNLNEDLDEEESSK